METLVKFKRLMDKVLLAPRHEQRTTESGLRKFMAKWFKKTQVYNYINIEEVMSK